MSLGAPEALETPLEINLGIAYSLNNSSQLRNVITENDLNTCLWRKGKNYKESFVQLDKNRYSVIITSKVTKLQTEKNKQSLRVSHCSCMEHDTPLSWRPFPSCCEPLYESEAKCKAFHMKISFACIWMKTNFHNKNFALSLVFIMRFTATRKWPILYYKLLLSIYKLFLEIALTCYLPFLIS